MNLLQAVEPPEDILIDRIKAGQTDEFEWIVRKYNAYLYKIGRAYGYNHDDTQDLMQETYISAYTNLAKFEHRASFKTWIAKIMLHQCYHKKQKFSFKKEQAVQVPIQEKNIPMFSDQHANNDKTIINMELHQVLENAIHQIPDAYRMVFTFRELTGMSVRETSEVLNITESNVKVRLNRAKQLLRREIEKTYSPEDIFEFNLIYCDTMTERVMAAIHALP